MQNAWPIYNLCPTALLFGMWGSPDKPGGLGAKFERAIVSEIVAINAEVGITVGSRLDPLGIEITAGPLYEAKDDAAHPSWTTDKAKAKKKGATAVAYDEGGSAGKAGNPSKANHGNVTPSFRKYQKGVEGEDVIADPSVEVQYRLTTSDGSVDNRQEFRSSRPLARQGGIGPGGVTADHFEQSITLSLIQLRRLRLYQEGEKSAERNLAAQAVLAAMGLCASALASDNGLDLRSRCLLVPDDEPSVEDENCGEFTLIRGLGKKGADDRELPARQKYALPADKAVELLNEAIVAARDIGVQWREEPVELVPSPELVELVSRSQLQESDDQEGEE